MKNRESHSSDPEIVNDMNDDEYHYYDLAQRVGHDYEPDEAPRVYNYQPAPRANFTRRR
jgi:hypothetical protein